MTITRDADEERKTEVTSAMIDAGVSALLAVAGISDDTDPIETVLDVFLATYGAKLHFDDVDSQYLKERTSEASKKVRPNDLNDHL